MAITEAEVRKMAKLARLALTDQETALHQAQLDRILDYMAELSEVDAEAAAPGASGAAGAASLREDEPKPFPDAERLLANAPQRVDSYFKVPKVIP